MLPSGSGSVSSIGATRAYERELSVVESYPGRDEART
jgi:hypothetical protein